MCLVLSREPHHTGPHVAHHRLQLRVGVLLEIDEAAVVLACLNAVAARFVEFPQALVGG
jgi:hypothetical protein